MILRERRGGGPIRGAAKGVAIAVGLALLSLWHAVPTASADLQKTLPINSADLSDARLATALDLAADAGVTQVQAGAVWWWLTRNGGARSYDWSDLDRLMDAAEARDMRVVLQLTGTPDWVHPDLEATVPNMHDRIWYPPVRDSTERDHWADFVTDLVTRYGDRVAHYEIWNEPNMSEWWRPWPNPTAYARLMRRAHDAARAVDPGTNIVLAGPSRNAIGYLSAYYDAVDRLFPDHGPASSYFFDVLGAHPYTYDRSPNVLDPQHTSSDAYGEVDENFLGFRRLREVVEQREGAPKPVYIGEFGYPTWLVEDELRAQYLADAYRLAADEGYVTALSWYTYVPPSWEPGGAGWAIVDENFAPTQTFEALRQVDTSAPNTTIDSGPSGVTDDNDPSFSFSSETGATFQCRLEPGGSWEACASPKSYTDLAEGVHTFSVRATDSAGNTDPSPARSEFEVRSPPSSNPPTDPVPAIGGPDPAVPIEPLAVSVEPPALDVAPPETGISKGPSGRIRDRTPTFRFSSSEPGSQLQCTVDRESFRPCASPFTVRKLDFGRHVFAVRGIDAVGNVDPSPDVQGFKVTRRR